MGKREDSLIGISVSVAALFLMACLLVVLAICCVLALFGSALSSDQSAFVVAAWIVLVCTLNLFSFLTFRAARALYEERPWALWIARVWGALIIGLGVMIMCDLQYSHQPTPDEYYGILLALPSIFLGTCWTIYLALPHVRARFHIQPE